METEDSYRKEVRKSIGNLLPINDLKFCFFKANSFNELKPKLVNKFSIKFN